MVILLKQGKFYSLSTRASYENELRNLIPMDPKT